MISDRRGLRNRVAQRYIAVLDEAAELLEKVHPHVDAAIHDSDAPSDTAELRVHCAADR